ncbi:ATP-binding protein [Streptomyces sp. NBC_00306]|uniref:ATP-binding protein n=1 Tax=Streptomyces sp. NBC_00306 TaxID=2975708 RepID=UPI002E27F652|nr:ATP-binding protein [Streptomyces sp. NBC_00306]
MARHSALWARALNPHSASLDCGTVWYTSSVTVRREPASVGRTRRLLAAQLNTWGLEELAETTQLLASELITNALLHAHGPIHVHMRVHAGVLRCEVEDADPKGPTRRIAATDAENGRGIELVDALAHHWGSDHTTTGKTTWFELPILAATTTSYTPTRR